MAMEKNTKTALILFAFVATVAILIFLYQKWKESQIDTDEPPIPPADQPPADLPPIQPPGPTEIILHGIVRDVSTGSPLGGANIDFPLDPQLAHAVSDSSGAFQVLYVPSSNPVVVRATKLGYYVKEVLIPDPIAAGVIDIAMLEVQADVDPPTDYTIIRVMDITGYQINAARVSGGGVSGLTASDGYVTLQLAEGTVVLTASASGFQTAYKTVVIPYLYDEIQIYLGRVGGPVPT